VVEPQSLWAGLWQQLPQLAYVELAGFESAHLLHRDFQRLLDAGARWQWRPTGELVEALRERKDAGEVALIREAAGIAVRALGRAVPELRAGMRELDVAGVLERALRAEGSEGFPFPTIVASGARSALPHARSSAKVLEPGDFLLIDFGAEYAGYCADVTRTFVVGQASERQREVYDVVRRANETAAAAVRAGMRELDVAGVLERALRAQGSEGFPFPTIVASGARSALPHARSSAKVLEPGDFLLIDFGAEYAGYCADVTRTFVMGRASEQQREIYDVVRQANEAAAATVRAGMRGRDADAIARDYIERRGYGELFGHSLGHGIGLEVHEAPRLARGADAPLAVGSVVTIEPGIYQAGWGGVRVEDDVHLAPEGPQVLTHFTRELVELA
jgi:Xaa-Pro aminopeptidase